MLVTEMKFCTEFASKHPDALKGVSVGYVSNDKIKMAKVVKISFDRSQTTYEDLLRFYFTIQDGTASNQIIATNDSQLQVANRIKD